MRKGKDYEDSIGKKYNKLTVKKLFKVGQKKMFLCECDCGNIIELTPIKVVSGNNTSCGCTVNKHGLYKHPLYNIWKAMKDRCLNPKSKDYENYGGRGITMNPEWIDVKKYIEDIENSLGPRPKGMTIDRIDNDEGYFIHNLKYANMSQQNVNKRYHNKLGDKFKNITNSSDSSGFELNMQRSGHKRYGYFNNIDDAIKIRDKWLDEYKSHPKEWIKNTINESYKEMF